jgi:hypothetical protein
MQLTATARKTRSGSTSVNHGKAPTTDSHAQKILGLDQMRCNRFGHELGLRLILL